MSRVVNMAIGGVSLTRETGQGKQVIRRIGNRPQRTQTHYKGAGMTPEEILTQAADWLESHEWQQDAITLYEDELANPAAACFVGSIRMSSATPGCCMERRKPSNGVAGR